MLKQCLIYLLVALVILGGMLLLAQIVKAPITISEAEAAEIVLEPVTFTTPELKAICGCESVGNWNAEPIQIVNGKLLRGRVVPQDVGACQINETYHQAKAESMGLDIHLYAGNVAYANYLYEKNGTRDWRASKACWDK